MAVANNIVDALAIDQNFGVTTILKSPPKIVHAVVHLNGGNFPARNQAVAYPHIAKLDGVVKNTGVHIHFILSLGSVGGSVVGLLQIMIEVGKAKNRPNFVLFLTQHILIEQSGNAHQHSYKGSNSLIDNPQRYGKAFQKGIGMNQGQAFGQVVGHGHKHHRQNQRFERDYDKRVVVIVGQHLHQHRVQARNAHHGV